MLHKDLAKALNISGAMVSRLAKRGMPTDTVERAVRWRSRHLEPARTKAWRVEGRAAAAQPPAEPAGIVAAAASTLQEVYDLASLAAELLPLGKFGVLEPSLRAALRGLPADARQALLIAVPAAADAAACADACAANAVPLAVWDALQADVLAAVLPSAAPADDAPPSAMPDGEADRLARFWFQVAAGEWRTVGS